MQARQAIAIAMFIFINIIKEQTIVATPPMIFDADVIPNIMRSFES